MLMMLALGLGGGRQELGQAWPMLMMLAWCLGGGRLELGRARLMLMMLALGLGGLMLLVWRLGSLFDRHLTVVADLAPDL